MEARDVAGADLVLGMAREHVREAVVLEPAALERSFTLKDLVRRGELMPRRGGALGEWLAELAAERELRDLLGAAAIDDVNDPVGAPLAAFRETAAELDELASRLVGVAWP